MNRRGFRADRDRWRAGRRCGANRGPRRGAQPIFSGKKRTRKGHVIASTKTRPYLFLPRPVSKLRVQSMYQDSPMCREEASSKLPWSLSFMMARLRAAERRTDSSRGP